MNLQLSDHPPTQSNRSEEPKNRGKLINFRKTTAINYRDLGATQNLG